MMLDHFASLLLLLSLLLPFSSFAERVGFEAQLEKRLQKQHQGQTLHGECLTYSPAKLPRYCSWYDSKNQKVLEEKYTDSLTRWQEQVILRKDNKDHYFKTVVTGKGSYTTEEITQLNQHKLFKTTEYKNKQFVKTKYFKIEPQKQRELLTCNEDRLKKWFQQMDLVQFAGSKDKNGYSTTAFGLKIHSSCIEARKGERNILNEISSSLLTGMSCLKNLKTPQADDHRARIEMLFRGEPKPKLTCANNSYDWSSANAYATISKANDPEHPKISLNPKTCSHWPSENLKSTFFHELFHNIGYSHGKDPEYAYTCAQCCFKDDPAKKMACELCGSSPKDIKDPQYLNKLITIYNTNFNIFRPHELVLESLRDNPKNPLAHQQRLLIGSSFISHHLGKAYLEQMPPSLKKQMDTNLVETIQAGANQPYLTPLAPQASSIAKAEFLIQNKKYQEAEKLLLGVKYSKQPPATLKDSNHKLIYREALLETKMLHKDLLRTLADQAMNKKNYSSANAIYDYMDALN